MKLPHTTPHHSTHQISYFYTLLVIILFDLSLSAQNCQFTNPWPTQGTSCYSSGGSVSDIFLGSICAAVGGSNISGSPFGMTVHDMTITFDGNLIIDQHVTFKRCTLLFTSNYGIVILDHILNNPSPQFVQKTTAIFEECLLKGCDGYMWKGISAHPGDQANNNGPILNISYSSIMNAKTGININSGSQYQGTYNLDNVKFESNDIGISCYDGSAPKELQIKSCNFNQCEYGLSFQNIHKKPATTVAINMTSLNTFTDCGTAIYAKDIEGLKIFNQIIENCNYGIQVWDLKSVGTSANLDIQNNTIKVIQCGICVDGAEENSLFTIFKNTLNGYYNGRSSGIDLKNARLVRMSIQSNPLIQDFGYGLRLRNNSHNSLTIRYNSNIDNNSHGIFYLDNRNIGSTGIFANNTMKNKSDLLFSRPERIDFTKNNFNANLDIKNSKFLKFQENIFTNNSASNTQNSLVKISNGASTTFCCNIISGDGLGLYLYGTNPETKLYNTTFENNKMVLEESMIGENSHTGNRWKGNTTGQLIGGSPDDNRFIINPSEGNSTLGFMRPQIINPAFVANVWFSPAQDTSNLCIPNCGLSFSPPTDPDSLIPAPDTIPDLGSCYPLGLDRDGDGICDQLDPDPDDSCNPVLLDLDGDGVCDTIDPDPSDSCNPLMRDTDRDGICDASDPDPFDPCIPNGMDADGDGICDNIDPEPNNSTPYTGPPTNTCVWQTDSNGDPFLSIGYQPLGLTYKIADLEAIATRTYTSNEYNQLNYIESMTFLFEVLHTSPYYLRMSTILKDKYTELCNSSISTYYKVSTGIQNLDKPSNALWDNLIKKEHYINRLKNVAAHLTDLNPIDSTHLENISAVYEIKKNEIRSLRDLLVTTRQTKATTLASEINSLPTDFLMFAVLKDFYLIYSKTELSKYSISESDVYTLRYISNLCPLVYGEAVYRAQSYLVSKDLNDFDEFQSNCQRTTGRNKSTASMNTESIRLEVSPNPTTGITQIQSNHPVQKVIIRNIQGDFIESKYFGQESKIQLDLSHLTSSVYLVEIQSSNGERIFKKIIRTQ